jgi:hypothetical protein
MTTTGILKPRDKQQIHFENGKTVDIQEVIFAVNKKDIWKETETFSKQFSKDSNGLRDLWHFVKEQITYQEDPIGFQYIQHPAALWKSKIGDCKSFTLFIVSVLQNLGIPYIIRFTSYRKGDVTHVYPIAILNGERVILDAVWDHFDDEKQYYREEDFKFQKNMSQIVEISGIGAARSVSETAAAYHAATKDIPNSILENDITEMSQAEFYRWLGYSVPTVSGIGNLESARAFRPPVLEFDSVGDLVGISFESAKRVVNKSKDAIVNAAKKVADALKEGWKKLVNWVFKAALPAAAPFFLYTFLKKDLGSKVEAKKGKQEAVINWISSVSGTDKTQIVAAIRAGITKKFGKQPEMALNEMAKASVSGRGIGSLSVIMDAVMMVVDLIKKIASLFKKPSPDVSKDDAGSETEIADAVRTADDGANPGGSKPSNIVVPIPSPANPAGNPANNYGETDDTPAPIEPGRTNLPAKTAPAPVPTGGNASGDNSMMMMAAAALVLYLITQN